MHVKLLGLLHKYDKNYVYNYIFHSESKEEQKIKIKHM